MGSFSSWCLFHILKNPAEPIYVSAITTKFSRVTMGSFSSWCLFHILKNPAEPILCDSTFVFTFVIHLFCNRQGSLLFVETSKSNHLARHRESSIIVMLPEDIVQSPLEHR